MTNLATVVRATRASAKAIKRMQRYSVLCRHAHGAEYKALRKAYDRARADYERAQRALAANPLPGDAPDSVLIAMDTETSPLPDAVASAWDVAKDPPS